MEFGLYLLYSLYNINNVTILELIAFRIKNDLNISLQSKSFFLGNFIAMLPTQQRLEYYEMNYVLCCYYQPTLKLYFSLDCLLCQF